MFDVEAKMQNVTTARHNMHWMLRMAQEARERRLTLCHS